MRIVIDLQGAQTESRFRGIGRYSLEISKAIARNRGNHEIFLALNGLFPHTIEFIRAKFIDLLPQENIRVWYSLGPVCQCNPSNSLRKQVAERMREAFLQSLHPDAIIITSLFEGFGDDGVTSVASFDDFSFVAAILYDLIPIISPDAHFKTNRLLKNYYTQKIEYLKKCNLLLSISESSRREAIDFLGFGADKVVNILGACDPSFRNLSLNNEEKLQLQNRINLKKPFIMYTGGADERKNIHNLIRAFAEMNRFLGERYQLVIVGKMPEEYSRSFKQTAIKCGLSDKDLILTGFVDDKTLLHLYNTCALFVFPSLHEGFGLPPLEAILCGAPTITSNTTSLPEVIGVNEAMFDPYSVRSICDKMIKILTDANFRKDIVKKELSHAKNFNWDNCAKKAISNIENKINNKSLNLEKVRISNISIFNKQSIRILLIKLDHMGDFILAIPAISKIRAKYPYANIDIVLGSWNKSIAETLHIFNNIYILDYFKKESHKNGSANEKEIFRLTNKLGEYDIAIDLRRQRDTRFLLSKIKAKIKVGYETFDTEIDNGLSISLPSFQDIQHKLTPLNKKNISQQMTELVDSLPCDINDFICLPDLIKYKQEKTKAVAIFPCAGNEVKEWGFSNYKNLITLLEKDDRIANINIYFSNTSDSIHFGIHPIGKIQLYDSLNFVDLCKSLLSNTVCVSNNSLAAHLASYLGIKVVGVYGGHESVQEWAPPFGNNNIIIHRNAHCSPCHIAAKKDCLNNFYCLNEINPEFVYDQVIKVLSDFYNINNISKEYQPKRNKAGNSNIVRHKLIESITDLIPVELFKNDLRTVAKYIDINHSHVNLVKRLFLDISEIVQVDAKTGIQRVVKSILKELLEDNNCEFHVLPVYAKIEKLGYFHANKFTQKFLYDEQNENAIDEPINYSPGDVFLGLDLNPHIVIAQREFYRFIRNHGVKVKFIVYDLLCLQMPKYFVPGTEEGFKKWLEVVSENDEAICISKSAANDLKSFIGNTTNSHLLPFNISWFHLGADFHNSISKKAIHQDSSIILDKLKNKINFLMVGTIEPRKGHAHVISAFENFWQKGQKINLIIVGKKGWMVDSLIKKILSHKELNKRLYWLDGISDQFLVKIYDVSTCMIAASEGEGFGLPLIEAAMHKVPIIARDIPVFREIAGDYASYFNDNGENNIENLIENWLASYRDKTHIKSDNMPWLTWKESVKNLKEIILNV